MAYIEMPEYLRLRFDEKTRAFNSISFATMTGFSSGISMYARAKLTQTLHVFDAPVRQLGLPLSSLFHAGILTSAVVVLAYICRGARSRATLNTFNPRFTIAV